MQRIDVGDYRISICREPDYRFGSGDNECYDSVLNLAGAEDFPRTISIQVDKDGCSGKTALIVSCYTPVDKCALPAGEYVFLMLNDVLCLFDPATMKMVKQTALEPIGTMLAAYAYHRDFILYGESEIYRVTEELTVRWRFAGKDIFVRGANEAPAFEMKSDRICLYDFKGDYYEISYDGTLID